MTARISEDVMAEFSGSGRPPSKLSDKVNHRLNMYAFAASAAGVSMLALAQPSEAKIVYTKTHRVIGTNGVYSLDLNRDAVVDFLIQEWSNQGFYPLLAKAALGNAVQNKFGYSSALALQRGAWIGPSQGFVGSGRNGELMAFFAIATETGSRFSGGPWLNVTNRYLGLQFQIHGKTHYGWARLSVRVKGGVTGILTGYAYETIPGKRLSAGQETEADGPGFQQESRHTAPAVPGAVAQAPRLGALALGAQGLSLWRRP
jgi:hypothetical protein